MKNVISLLQEIENEPIKAYLLPKLALLLDEINYILLKIKFCESAEQASSYFDLLDKIQLTVARFHHKYDINLPDSLNRFIINFDRLHDSNERQRLFNEIGRNQHIYDLHPDTILLKLLDDIKRNPVKSNVLPILPFLHEEINRLLTKIKLCKNLQSANDYFKLLEKIQGLVSILISKNEIQLPEALWKLYKDFDRIDDKEWKEILFNKIKYENYSFEGIPALDERFR